MNANPWPFAGVLSRKVLIAIGTVSLLLVAFWYLITRVDVDVSKPGTICDVHNIPLQEGTVPFSYGLRRPTTEEIEAHQKQFPHAWSSFHDGCVMHGARYARVSFCPECRIAEANWNRDQERKLAPIVAHWRRVRELVQAQSKFSDVHAFIRREKGPTVGIEGRVNSDADLAELKRMIETMQPPSPVDYLVRVAR